MSSLDNVLLLLVLFTVAFIIIFLVIKHLFEYYRSLKMASNYASHEDTSDSDESETVLEPKCFHCILYVRDDNQSSTYGFEFPTIYQGIEKLYLKFREDMIDRGRRRKNNFYDSKILFEYLDNMAEVRLRVFSENRKTFDDHGKDWIKEKMYIFLASLLRDDEAGKSKRRSTRRTARASRVQPSAAISSQSELDRLDASRSSGRPIVADKSKVTDLPMPEQL